MSKLGQQLCYNKKLRYFTICADAVREDNLIPARSGCKC